MPPGEGKATAGGRYRARVVGVFSYGFLVKAQTMIGSLFSAQNVAESPRWIAGYQLSFVDLSYHVPEDSVEERCRKNADHKDLWLPGQRVEA